MDFEALLNSDKPTLIDFYATWCGPCQTMMPILQQVKQHVGDTASIVKIDIDKNQAIAAQFGVRSVPTLVVMKAGEMVWRQSGVVPPHELARILEHFAKPAAE